MADTNRGVCDILCKCAGFPQLASRVFFAQKCRHFLVSQPISLQAAEQSERRMCCGAWYVIPSYEDVSYVVEDGPYEKLHAV